MVTVTSLVLPIARVVGVLFALAITVTSFRAYRRTTERTFLYTMIGFVCLTLGLVIESYLYGVLTLDLTTVHAIESLIFAVGFVVLYISMTRNIQTED